MSCLLSLLLVVFAAVHVHGDAPPRRIYWNDMDGPSDFQPFDLICVGATIMTALGFAKRRKKRPAYDETHNATLVDFMKDHLKLQVAIQRPTESPQVAQPCGNRPPVTEDAIPLGNTKTRGCNNAACEPTLGDHGAVHGDRGTRHDKVVKAMAEEDLPETHPLEPVKGCDSGGEAVVKWLEALDQCILQLDGQGWYKDDITGGFCSAEKKIVKLKRFKIWLQARDEQVFQLEDGLKWLEQPEEDLDLQQLEEKMRNESDYLKRCKLVRHIIYLKAAQRRLSQMEEKLRKAASQEKTLEVQKSNEHLEKLKPKPRQELKSHLAEFMKLPRSKALLYFEAQRFSHEDAANFIADVFQQCRYVEEARDDPCIEFRIDDDCHLEASGA